LHEILANPMWTSLTTSHAAFARTSGPLKRFPSDVAPFCAVEHDSAEIGGASLFTKGETVYFLATIPRFPANFTVLGESGVLQMIYDGKPPESTEADAATLTDADAPAMKALTALVYPEFFRSRTSVLGRYIGLHGPDRLNAMCGQRLACTGYREISAVCTHPEERGKGHAGRLIRQQTRAIIAEGRTPFLHVSASNKNAWGLYENVGFAASRELRFVKVRID
jgi:ribosomal protein S18 acetylase RimI-like enzyme